MIIHLKLEGESSVLKLEVRGLLLLEESSVPRKKILKGKRVVEDEKLPPQRLNRQMIEQAIIAIYYYK